MINTFNKEALQTNGKILVAFKAPWCAPCKTITPVLEEMSEEGYNIFAVDVDTDSDTAAKYGIRGVPTLITFENGKEVTRSSGVKPKAELIELLS